MTARVAPAVAVFLALGAALAADPLPAAPKAPPPGPKDGPELVGVAVCQDCHDQEDPTRKRLYQETRGYEFIRLRENLVWAAYDPHSQAFKNLATAGPDLNPTAKRMEDRLRPTRGPGYTVAADVQCLACHASTLRPGVGREAASFATADGVGCEMCHGHGSKYRDVHQESKLDQAAAPPGAVRVVPWRDWDPAKKHAEYGLVNLRDPGTAAARCASCHVGNPAEGRFVTHEMYAAGHPPLPPFDLSAYAREQPRHWGLPGDMPYITRLAGRDPTRAWAVFHHRAGESAAARRLAEGAVASLRATLDLTGQLAAADTAGGGLDYAAFDCYSCHHDLKYPSDRQARGYVGPPGRPLFRPAPFALARLVVGHAAGLPGGEGLKGQAEALLAAEKELAGAFGARTFGDPALIRPAAEKAKAWCDRVLTGLHGVKYDRAAAAGLLAKVVEAGQGKVADPEVAQLYAWAFETLELDLDRRKDPKVPPPAVADLHKRLAGHVVTRLRPNEVFVAEAVPPHAPAAPPEPVAERIGERMRTFNAFRAADFNRAFGELKPLADGLGKP